MAGQPSHVINCDSDLQPRSFVLGLGKKAQSPCRVLKFSQSTNPFNIVIEENIFTRNPICRITYPRKWVDVSKHYALIVIGTILLFIQPSAALSYAAPTNSSFSPAADEISITIDFGNQTTKNLSNLTGTNVLEITQEVANVEFYYDTWGFAFVTEIDGLANNQQKDSYWQYWVNGEYASTAANTYLVQSGDTIIWRYVSSQVNPPKSIANDPSTIIGLVGVSCFVVMFLGFLYRRSTKK